MCMLCVTLSPRWPGPFFLLRYIRKLSTLTMQTKWWSLVPKQLVEVVGEEEMYTCVGREGTGRIRAEDAPNPN